MYMQGQFYIYGEQKNVDIDIIKHRESIVPEGNKYYPSNPRIGQNHACSKYTKGSANTTLVLSKILSDTAFE